jgi:hypothetical protein
MYTNNEFANLCISIHFPPHAFGKRSYELKLHPDIWNDIINCLLLTIIGLNNENKRFFKDYRIFV